MNKAILVIDMPETCYECPLAVKTTHSYDVCCITGSCIMSYDKYKFTWCPLKPMPEKYDVLAAIENNPNYNPSYDIGRNDCIDEILGK